MSTRSPYFRGRDPLRELKYTTPEAFKEAMRFRGLYDSCTPVTVHNGVAYQERGTGTIHAFLPNDRSTVHGIIYEQRRTK